jgi:hypothetical protein
MVASQSGQRPREAAWVAMGEIDLAGGACGGRLARTRGYCTSGYRRVPAAVEVKSGDGAELPVRCRAPRARCCGPLARSPPTSPGVRFARWRSLTGPGVWFGASGKARGIARRGCSPPTLSPLAARSRAGRHARVGSAGTPARSRSRPDGRSRRRERERAVGANGRCRRNTAMLETSR